MRVVSQEIRNLVSGETRLSTKCRTCRIRMFECALTSGQGKVSQTSLPVERPPNCLSTSLSSASLPKVHHFRLFSEESIDTGVCRPYSSSFSIFDFLHVDIRQHVFRPNVVHDYFSHDINSFFFLILREIRILYSWESNI